MSSQRSLFATPVHCATIDGAAGLNDEIETTALSYAQEDDLGQRWCAEHGYPGYTSYGSVQDLPARAPCFGALKKRLDFEAAAFSTALAFDLGRGRLKLDGMWVNVMERGGVHSGHIHPHSVISGTYYARAPKGASSIRFEDPRLAMMMAAPPRRDDAPESLRNFVYLAPQEGAVLMWESWLRHEVMRHASRRPRISVSFNYRWG